MDYEKIKLAQAELNKVVEGILVDFPPHEANDDLKTSLNGVMKLIGTALDPTPKELTFQELKAYVAPMLHFGVMETKLYRKDDGYKLEIWERDEYQLTDADGNDVVDDYDLTNPFSIFIYKEDKIGVIEHSFRHMTLANKYEQMYLLQLIGVKVLGIPASEILDATPLPSNREREFNDLMKKVRGDV